MLRYLEQQRLVVPRRTASGYRVYGLAELNRLHALRELRRVHGVGLDELAFASRLRNEPALRRAVDGWLAAGDDAGAWIDWEQRKHERLIAA
jgi:DNA-binding transcriptional MerR regulator